MATDPPEEVEEERERDGRGWNLRVGLEERKDELHTATVGLDKWPWLRAVIASAFVVVWMAMLVWDWFVQQEGVLPGWFQGLGVIVLAYLLGVDLVTNFFRRGRLDRERRWRDRD